MGPGHVHGASPALLHGHRSQKHPAVFWRFTGGQSDCGELQVMKNSQKLNWLPVVALNDQLIARFFMLHVLQRQKAQFFFSLRFAKIAIYKLSTFSELGLSNLAWLKMNSGEPSTFTTLPSTPTRERRCLWSAGCLLRCQWTCPSQAACSPSTGTAELQHTFKATHCTNNFIQNEIILF